MNNKNIEILAGDLSSFMSWVDEKRRMLVYANADTPEDAAEARRNGAQGIGLVRTEHMFYSSEVSVCYVYAL